VYMNFATSLLRKLSHIHQVFHHVQTYQTSQYQNSTISPSSSKMKTFFATILALAAAVTAAPALEARGCTPATYSCTADAQGWQVCDTTGNWVVSSPRFLLHRLFRC
jgi:hypothetical protein